MKCHFNREMNFFFSENKVKTKEAEDYLEGQLY